jgi:hypothetical protein
MTRTITGTYGVGITLSSGNNPVTVATTAKIAAGVSGNSSTGINGNVLYGPGGGGKSWSITNYGVVNNTNVTESTAIALGQDGIASGSFVAGSYVTSGVIVNKSGGTIAGAEDAINVWGSATITNMAGGTITGNGFAVGLYGAQGTVFNAGVILASGGSSFGIFGYDGVDVTNSAGATISGGINGIYLGGEYQSANAVDYGVHNPGNAIYASTIANAGTITGLSGHAVSFGGSVYSPADRVILYPSAVFHGTVGDGDGVLELASGATTGTITGIGSQYLNVASLQFGSNAHWKVLGNTSVASLGGVTISGFAAGDTIDLTGFVATTVTFASNTLTLTNAGGTHATLHMLGSFSSAAFHVSTYNTTGTSLVDCFAAGTHIATPAGAVRVEDLTPGETVLAHFAGSAPVQWVGRRHVDCTHHPDPSTVWPVRVAAGALGVGRPGRDLLLSPNHAIYVSDTLIPVRLLVNGSSIIQMPVDDITYFHVELTEHDLLLAEGILAESYLDAGDRSNFANGGEAVRLHPDFATRPEDTAALWEMKGCAPLILHGPRLDAARDRVNQMADRIASRDPGGVAVGASDLDLVAQFDDAIGGQAEIGG